MKSKLLILSLWLILKSVAADDGEYDIDWNVYKATFGKSYDSLAEEKLAKSAFTENFEEMEDFNRLSASKKLGWKKGINHLSDMQSWDLARLNTFDQTVRTSDHKFDTDADLFLQKMIEGNSTNIPKELDWRKYRDRVSGVKDQGTDLTDWAIATTGVLEGQMLASRMHARLLPLSSRNLVDCQPYFDSRLMSGNIVDSLELVKQKGIMSEYSYASSRSNSSCKYDPEKVALRIKGLAEITTKLDEQLLRNLVYRYGPVAAAISATKELFTYASGVFIDPECITDSKELNRAVLIVGYGEDKRYGKYWIIKNSLGRDWGEQGYFKLARGENNHCGIGTHIVIPYFE